MKKTLGMMTALMFVAVTTPRGQDEYIDLNAMRDRKRAVEALESQAAALDRQAAAMEAQAEADRRAAVQAEVDGWDANTRRLEKAAADLKAQNARRSASRWSEIDYLEGLSRAADVQVEKLDALKAENAELKRELANANAKLDIVANALADIYDKLDELAAK